MADRSEAVLAALAEIRAEGGTWATAAEIAWRAGIQGDRRHGNGAVTGSWSGFTAPALAAANTLRALVKRGEVDAFYVGEPEYRHYYSLPR